MSRSANLLDLPKAVVSWLTYEKAIHDDLKHREDALATAIYPLLEKTAVIEKAAEPIRGRKRQIDFVGRKAGTGQSEGTWAFALETKFLNDSRNHWDRIVLDLFRLDLLVKFPISPRAERLFLAVIPSSLLVTNRAAS